MKAPGRMRTFLCPYIGNAFLRLLTRHGAEPAHDGLVDMEGVLTVVEVPRRTDLPLNGQVDTEPDDGLVEEREPRFDAGEHPHAVVAVQERHEASAHGHDRPCLLPGRQWFEERERLEGGSQRAGLLEAVDRAREEVGVARTRIREHVLAEPWDKAAGTVEHRTRPAQDRQCTRTELTP